MITALTSAVAYRSYRGTRVACSVDGGVAPPIPITPSSCNTFIVHGLSQFDKGLGVK